MWLPPWRPMPASIPLIHVEAGLRSYDRRMPEEHNRVITDHLADLCLAPTPTASQNLRAEGIPEDRIIVTGNTIVEAVNTLLPSESIRKEILGRYHLSPAHYVLSTFHRPENVDDPRTFARIFEELARLPLPVLLPLHPRSKAHIEQIWDTAFRARSRIIEPIGYHGVPRPSGRMRLRRLRLRRASRRGLDRQTPDPRRTEIY